MDKKAAAAAALNMREAYRMEYDPGDAWGSVMSWRFNIAEELYRRGDDCPAAWEFRAGACGVPDPEEYDFDLSTVATPDLIDFGNELAESADALRAAGKDY